MFHEIEKWQSQRLGKFTASDIHKLLVSGKGKTEYFGKGALTYIDEKIAELITGQPCKDLTGLSALEWGNAHEYEGLMLLQGRLGVKLEIYGGSNNKFVPFNDYSGGSPDALSIDTVVEAKCPINPSIHASNLVASINSYSHGRSNEWMNKYRKDYYCQLQFNMLCCNKRKGIFASYDPRPIDPNHRLAIIHISQDEELQNEIAERITKAAEIVSETLELLYSPSLLIASHDDGITLIESASK